MSAGVFGMQRTILRWPPSQRDSAARRTPAAMLMTSFPSTPGNPARALRRSCGLVARTSTSAASVSASGAALALTASSAASRLRASADTSITEIEPRSCPLRSSPPMSAAAMLPPPRNAMFMRRSFPAGAGRRSPSRCGPWWRPRQSPAPYRRSFPWTGYRSRIAAQAFIERFHSRKSAIGAGRRDRHEAAQPQPRQGGDRGGEGSDFFHARAALRRLRGDIDLDEDVERGEVRRPLLGEPLCDLRPIDASAPSRSARQPGVTCCSGAAR